VFVGVAGEDRHIAVSSVREPQEFMHIARRRDGIVKRQRGNRNIVKPNGEGECEE